LQVTRQEALVELQELMRVSQSYSLDLLNNITIYVGLKYARQQNWLTVWTGDDADTLFAGYGFKGDSEAWRATIRAAIPRINPDATAIAKSLGITMAYPFLHPGVVEIAGSLDLSDNVQWVEGDEPGNFYDQFNPEVMQQKAKPWGKAILRHAAKDLLSDDVLWRQKTHLMYGSAMCRLEWDLAHSLTEQDRQEVDAARTLDGSRRRCFINDVHRALYLLYIRTNLQAAAPREGEQPCEWCGAGGIVEGEYGYCRVCGAYPAKSRPAEYCPDDEC
jgi:asparagine synthase (glutamine-hydrolysing)